MFLRLGLFRDLVLNDGQYRVLNGPCRAENEQDGEQNRRWLAVKLKDIEPRLRKIKEYRRI